VRHAAFEHPRRRRGGHLDVGIGAEWIDEENPLRFVNSFVRAMQVSNDFIRY
jgi:hypothetical protein